MSSKPFEELTEAELDALDKREWTSAEITAAMSMALEARDMEAVAALMRRLAVVDPDKAQLILDFLMLTEVAAAQPGESGGEGRAGGGGDV